MLTPEALRSQPLLYNARCESSQLKQEDFTKQTEDGKKYIEVYIYIYIYTKIDMLTYKILFKRLRSVQ